MTTTMTPDQLELLAELDDAVRRRAEAAKMIQETSGEIAQICVDARGKGIVMRVLAQHVQVYDQKAGQLRPVTRQSVDGMIAELEGRERAPRRRGASKPAANGNSGKINMDAFS
jgi:hypothetical protein